MEYQHIDHMFEPVYNEQSRILILGSFPSVKSREQGFYYGHPRNRFWKVLAAVLEEPEPVHIDEKKRLLLSHHIALWDVIDSCDIRGSSDASIRNVVPAAVAELLPKTEIGRIYVNGQTAGRLYRRFLQEQTGVEARVLPSTSPANAAYSLQQLIDIWSFAIHTG